MDDGWFSRDAHWCSPNSQQSANIDRLSKMARDGWAWSPRHEMRFHSPNLTFNTLKNEKKYVGDTNPPKPEVLAKSDICPAAFSQIPTSGRGRPLINRNVSPKTPAMTRSLKGTRQNDTSIKTIALLQGCGYKYSEYSKTASQNASMGKDGLSPGKQWKPVAVNEAQNTKHVLPIATTRKALCTAKGELTKQKVPPAPIFGYLPPISASLWTHHGFNNNLRDIKKIKKQIIFLHIIPFLLSSARPQFDNLISWESKRWKFKLPRVLIAALLHC